MTLHKGIMRDVLICLNLNVVSRDGMQKSKKLQLLTVCEGLGTFD